MRYVPVVDSNQRALMPTSNWKADKLVACKKALRRFKAGIFYIQLVDRNEGKTQEVAVGIDPGSKREGFTVKSESHTYLNVLSEAVDWVKDAVKIRSEMRRTRRSRNTPYRKCRWNRSIGGIPPSTKARWQAKLRIANILKSLFPVTTFVVEDIKAVTHKGGKKWNKSFSPLEVGKKWFYSELEKLGKVVLKQGWETFEMRERLGLKKSSSKLSDKFDAHNVDSWVLANSYVGGHTYSDNTSLIKMIPLQFHRRQLHVLNFSKGGLRKNYGGTMSLGLKRGSLVKHKKYGITYVGGTSKGKVSLHSIEKGERLTQSTNLIDIIFLTFNNWRIQQFLPALKRQGFLAVSAL
jgi:hypothetical protein